MGALRLLLLAVAAAGLLAAFPSYAGNAAHADAGGAPGALLPGMAVVADTSNDVSDQVF